MVQGPVQKRRFQIVKLEERIAPTCGCSGLALPASHVDGMTSVNTGVAAVNGGVWETSTSNGNVSLMTNLGVTPSSGSCGCA